MPIVFSNADIAFSLNGKSALKQSVNLLCKKEGFTIKHLSYVFCSDLFLLDINQRFLNHDTFTDIITFDLSEQINKLIEGEIYMSIDRIRENASKLGEPFDREFKRVMFHGALHLCGYKDKTKADKTVMRGKEDFYLNSL